MHTKDEYRDDDYRYEYRDEYRDVEYRDDNYRYDYRYQYRDECRDDTDCDEELKLVVIIEIIKS